MLFDTHVHLIDPRFDEDRAAVLARARAAGLADASDFNLMAARAIEHLAQRIENLAEGLEKRPDKS